jgi:uncharacterized membrane protein (UPF0127 family)
MFLEKGRPILPNRLGALRNTSNGHLIADAVELATTRAARRRGLLGRDRLDPGHALIIAPCSSIHTWFMRFPIDVIFVRRNGTVVKTRAAIPAWRMAFGGGAYAVVELPAGAAAQAGVKAGDLLNLEFGAGAAI